MIAGINNEDLRNPVLQFDGYSIRRRQDSIIQVEFAPGSNFTLEDARHQMEIFRQLKTADKCLLLAIFSEGTAFDKEVREFIASNEVSQLIKADALVIKGLALKILANGYLQINRPIRPSRVFNNTSNALAWLHGFL